MPECNWLIFYDDQSIDCEVFTDSESAIRRYDDVCVQWSCHLFRRVDRNELVIQVEPPRFKTAS